MVSHRELQGDVLLSFTASLVVGWIFRLCEGLLTARFCVSGIVKPGYLAVNLILFSDLLVLFEIVIDYINGHHKQYFRVGQEHVFIKVLKYTFLVLAPPASERCVNNWYKDMFLEVQNTTSS